MTKELEQPFFDMLLADLSVRFINIPVDAVDAEIIDSERQICERLDIDIASLWQWESDSPDDLYLTHLYRRREGPPVPDRMNALDFFPWTLGMVRSGRIAAVASLEEAPAEAARDVELWRHYGIQSNLTIPLSEGGGPTFGAIGFNHHRTHRWTDALVRRFQLVAHVFANALIRKRKELLLRESETRLAMALDAAEAGPWVLDEEAGRFWVGGKLMGLMGLPPREHIGIEEFIDLILPEDQARMRAVIETALRSPDLTAVEYRIRRADGQVRWMHSLGRPCPYPAGGNRLMGLTSDVTARKEAESRLTEALEEVRVLRDRLENENLYLRAQVLTETGRGSIVGESEPVAKMLSLARRVAQTDSAVLITGETGTGKELLAQFIHDQGVRKRKTMVKVNCAALPPALIESELFGREKGAYTGAMTQQVGRFELADGSTILLDEIGDLPLELQGKLLRVLQDGQFERLGGRRSLRTDARVIAATNRNLAQLVREGKFREDLFHRLNVFPVEVPPLRSRLADIPLLVWTFIEEFNVKMGRAVDAVPKTTLETLKQYSWPGNVRELRNVIERSMIVGEGKTLTVDLPTGSPGPEGKPMRLEEIERLHILDILARTRWKISGKGGAAEILGLKPTTLQSRLKKLSITRPSGRVGDIS